MNDMINPCVWCYQRYGKQYSDHCNDTCEYAKVVKENKLLKEEMDIPIRTIEELATQFCCITECKNCPVEIHGYEKRTKNEKENLHIPCCENLYKWIINQAERKLYGRKQDNDNSRMSNGHNETY